MFITGTILLIGSVAGLIGLVNLAHYSAKVQNDKLRKRLREVGYEQKGAVHLTRI